MDHVFNIGRALLWDYFLVLTNVYSIIFSFVLNNVKKENRYVVLYCILYGFVVSVYSMYRTGVRDCEVTALSIAMQSFGAATWYLIVSVTSAWASKAKS